MNKTFDEYAELLVNTCNEKHRITHRNNWLANKLIGDVIERFCFYLYMHSLMSPTIESAMAEDRVTNQIEKLIVASVAEDLMAKVSAISLALNTAHIEGKMHDYFFTREEFALLSNLKA